MALDLLEIERVDTARMELLHPVTEEPTGCFLTLAGPGSEQHEAAQQHLVKRRLALIRRFKREEDIPNEINYQSLVEFLADVTLNIEGLEKGGKSVEFSRKVAVELFLDKKRFGPEFAAQATKTLTNVEAFSKA